MTTIVDLSYLFLLLTPLVFLFFFSTRKQSSHLPPGPRRWPIIGNILQVGNNPLVSTAIFAQQYGPLISLRLGSQLLVVASSPETAKEILKIQDRFFSSRFVPSAFHQSFTPYCFVWSTDCNDNWRSLKTLCRNEMFSGKALEAQSSLRDEKLSQLMDFLGTKKGEAVNVEDVVFTTMFNTLSNIIFGRDFLDLKDEQGTAGGLRGKLFRILEYAITPNISDFFPSLERFDLQGINKGTLVPIEEVFSFWKAIIKEKRALLDSSMAPEKKCFLDHLLENGFFDDQINILGLELFTAGTDTTTSTIIWAMSELVKNKHIMSKLQAELKTEIKSDTVIESELSKLSYLNACIKETLRLHPPVPFLIPRRAIQSCEVMDYTIPEGAQVLVNVWAIGRDPKVWEDPLSFKPERFLDSELDFKGQDFEFIPFGAGRRMCPGLSSGIKSVQSIIASLLLRYDWVLPNNEDPEKLDMTEKYGVTLQKEKPLQLIFKHQRD